LSDIDFDKNVTSILQRLVRWDRKLDGEESYLSEDDVLTDIARDARELIKRAGLFKSKVKTCLWSKGLSFEDREKTVWSAYKPSCINNRTLQDEEPSTCQFCHRPVEIENSVNLSKLLRK